jgi:transcriptional regulator GlxA family with amidase domain
MTGADPLAGLCAYLLWLGSGEQDGWHGHARTTLRFMLRLVGSGPLPAATADPVLPPVLRLAVEEIRARWSAMPLRRIRIDDLAAAASVSRGYLNRLFHTGFGLSASTALEHLRAARAESLLTGTDLTVEAIAGQCGFADPSHFSHRFGAIHGMSPSGYRSAGRHLPSVLDHPGVRLLRRLVWD